MNTLQRTETNGTQNLNSQRSGSAVRRNGGQGNAFNCFRRRGFLQFFGMSATIFLFLLITVVRFIVGALKLSSDCPKEKHVAEYLFAKSCLACLFWATLVALRCNEKLMDAMDNLFIEVYVTAVEGFFSLIWLIVGTVWTIGMREQMLDECPVLVNHWNHIYITCAMALVIFDWIGVGIFLFYSLYIMFDNTEV